MCENLNTIIYRAPHISQVTNLAPRSLQSRDVHEGRLERAAVVLAVEVGGGKGQRRGSLVVRLPQVVLRVEVIPVGRTTKVCAPSRECGSYRSDLGSFCLWHLYGGNHLVACQKLYYFCIAM